MSTTWRVDAGDATEWLAALPTESVDLILTDPAYESLEKHRAKGTTTRLKVSKSSSNEWFPIFGNSLFPAFLAQCYRVLKQNRHFYLLCDQETMFVVKPMAEAAGFTFWKPVIWHKTGGLGMGYHWRANYEVVLFFEKGKRKLNDLSIPDVLSFPRVRGQYPTQKPVELLQVFVGQSTQPGEVVVDPFCGSGSAGEAALDLGRSFAGSDISARAVDVARARLDRFPGRDGALPTGAAPQLSLSIG